jgi:hypothetical protein
LLTGGDVRKVGLELSTAAPKSGLASSSTDPAAFNPDCDTSPKNFQANQEIRSSVSSSIWGFIKAIFPTVA